MIDSIEKLLLERFGAVSVLLAWFQCWANGAWHAREYRCDDVVTIGKGEEKDFLRRHKCSSDFLTLMLDAHLSDIFGINRWRFVQSISNQTVSRDFLPGSSRKCCSLNLLILQLWIKSSAFLKDKNLGKKSQNIWRLTQSWWITELQLYQDHQGSVANEKAVYELDVLEGIGGAIQ